MMCCCRPGIRLIDQLDRMIHQQETIAGLNPLVELESFYDVVSRRTQLKATIGGNQDDQNLYQYDFLDQPKWIRQQSQGAAVEDTHGVAFKRVHFSYNEIGQLTHVNRFKTPTTAQGTPSLRTAQAYDDNRIPDGEFAFFGQRERPVTDVGLPVSCLLIVARKSGQGRVVSSRPAVFRSAFQRHPGQG